MRGCIAPLMKGKDLGRYVSLIHEADAQIGRLLDRLRESGLAEDTLVVVTGDHGEGFGPPHGISGHGFTVYEDEVRGPLVFWNPRLFRGGSRSNVIGSHPDLAPTVLDVLGIQQPRGWDGRSLFAAARPPRVYLFAAAWGRYLLGVREQNWKYIYDVRGGHEELYDLAKDPDERKNAANAYNDHARRLRQHLAAWLQVEQQRRAAAGN
jgi:lipoteichoic acid synthase